MYTESIVSLHEKEEELKRFREESAQRAKKTVADAYLAGEAQLREADERAVSEIKQMMNEINERAKADAEKKASETENKKAVLRVRAERNTEKAAALIVERIVNG